MESREKKGTQEGEKNSVKEGMTGSREREREEGYSAQVRPVGTQTQYLWMFISQLVLREAHIFHLGMAGHQARRSFCIQKWFGRVTDALTCMRECAAEVWVVIGFCLHVTSLNPNLRFLLSVSPVYHY